MIYLDNSATTQPLEEVISAVTENMRNNFGNASSLHHMGVCAEEVIKEAKQTILSGLGMSGNIFFTSGATESSNTVLSGIPKTYRHSGNEIVSTTIEHPATANPLKKLEEAGYKVICVSPQGEGSFESRIIDAVNENTLLVSVMWVNNETGFLTDTAEIYSAVKRKNPKTIVHVDAVQGFRKLPTKTLKADLISLSAHKIHGVKGVGALYCADKIRFEPFLYGGGQQKDPRTGNERSGTEPIDLIAGFSAAVKHGTAGDESRFIPLYDRLAELLGGLDDVVINSYHNAKHIMNFSVRGVRSEIMLHFLEERQIYVSSGSACSKGKTSGVLKEFGVSDKDADCAIRASFGYYTRLSDTEALAEGIADGIKRFRR